jgi:hypothetical protein
VEAVIVEALSVGAEILAIFQDMIGVLQIMRNKNLSYGKSSMKHEAALPGGLWEDGGPGVPYLFTLYRG